jgi:putative addiction module component (TIGR02574 family)
MESTLPEIESQARKLSASDRARLALRLLESLEQPDGGDVAGEWRIEIERRWDEIERGAAIGVPAAEAFSRARDALE